MIEGHCESCGEFIDEVIVESFERTGMVLCLGCAEADFESDWDIPDEPEANP